MNPLNAYRNSFYTTPLNTMLAQLHNQAAVFSKQAAQFIEDGDIVTGRQHIQYVQDIIAFLRSSLDMSLEVSEKTDSTYAFYYQIMVKWFLNPEKFPDDFGATIEFWESWAKTWAQVKSMA